MNPVTLFELVFMADFRAGFLWGVAGLVCLLVIPRREVPRPIWGLVAATAVLLATRDMMLRRPGLAAGIILLAVGGELMRRHRSVGWVVVGAGAILTAMMPGFEDNDLWVHVASIPYIVVAGWAIAKVDHSQGESGITVLMIGGTVFGVWATVPEPNLARVLLGASAALVVTGWPLRRARLGDGGAFAVAGLLAVAVALGGENRAGSLVGGWAALGAFALAVLGPAVVRIRPWRLFALHSASVLVAARLAGLQESPLAAAAIAIPAVIATLIVGWRMARMGYEEVASAVEPSSST